MSNFPRLDEIGLTRLVNKLAEKIKANENVQADWNNTDSSSPAFIKNKPTISSHTDTAYGTCSTAAATAAKVVTLTDSNWELRVGAMVTIKFTNTNTANNPTLNVNGTGAKSIYYNTAVITTGSLFTAGEANRYTTYMYDGTYWVWMGSSIDRNTTYSAMSKSELTTGTATTSRVVRADYLKQGIEEIIRPAIDDITDVYGAKNLMPKQTSYLASSDGSIYIEPELNADGTIDFGEFSGGTYYNCDLTISLSLPKTGDYKFTSGLTDASDSTAYIEVYKTANATAIKIYNEPVVIESVNYIHKIRLVSKDGQSRTYKPMLRTIGIESNTYVPYAMTNKELTDKVNDLINVNVSFPSYDTTDANATSWTSVTKVDSNTNISLNVFFQRITQMFKNVRYLNNKKISNYDGTAISEIKLTGDGTYKYFDECFTLSDGYKYIIRHYVDGSRIRDYYKKLPSDANWTKYMTDDFTHAYSLASFGSSSETIEANVIKTYNVTSPNRYGTYLVMIVNLVNESHQITDMDLSIGGRSYKSGANSITSPCMNIVTLNANTTISVHIRCGNTMTTHLTGAVLFLQIK